MQPYPFYLRIRALFLAGIALSRILTASSPARAEQIRDQLWITDGEVRAIARKDNTIFLGGQFSRVGPAVGSVGAFDAASGAVVAPYFGVTGTVNAMIPDGADGYYVGGMFAGVKGEPRNNLAHIDGAGRVRPWNPNVTGEVRTLALSGSTLFVGGSFTQVGGQARQYLASVDTATGAPLAWAPNPDGFVEALHVLGNSLYVGGAFHTMAGSGRDLAAAFDIPTGSLNGWNPDGDDPSPTPSRSVFTITSLGNTIYMGGNFTFFGGAFRLGLASVDATSGALTSWNPGLGFDTEVRTIVVTQQFSFPFTVTVWFGGSFTTVGGQPRNNIASVDGTTGGLSSFNPGGVGANGKVRGLLVRINFITGNPVTVTAGGEFTSMGGLSRPYLSSMSPTGTVSTWDTRPNGPVHAILFGLGTVVAGGNFTSAGMTTRVNFAALDATTGAPTPWNPGADGAVNALVLHGNSLYIGGAFGLFEISARTGAAEVDLTTMTVTGWQPTLSCNDITCTTPVVNAIARAALSNVVYLGGLWTHASGQFRRNLAATDGTTGAALAFNVNPNFQIRALALRERETFPFDVISVFAGGDFDRVNGGLHGMGDGGVARYSVAEFVGATGEVTAWNPSPAEASGMFALAYTSGGIVGPGVVWMGGQFTTMGGQPRGYAAAVDAGTGLATSWNPDANGIVRSLMFRSGQVYLGGDFTSVGGQPRNRLASVDAVGVTSWNPNSPSSVLALADHGGTIYAAGSFARVSNHPHAFFAGIGDGTVTGVEPEPVTGPAPRTVLRASPNPFGDRTIFQFAMPRTESASVNVYDVSGRLVRRLHRGALEAGPHVMEWSGRDEAERPVASGIYFVRVQAPSLDVSSKVYRLR